MDIRKSLNVSRQMCVSDDDDFRSSIPVFDMAPSVGDINTICVSYFVLSLLSILINYKRLKFGSQHLQLQHFSSLLFGFVSLSDSIFAKSPNYIA